MLRLRWFFLMPADDAVVYRAAGAAMPIFLLAPRAAPFIDAATLAFAMRRQANEPTASYRRHCRYCCLMSLLCRFFMKRHFSCSATFSYAIAIDAAFAMPDA